MKHKTLGLFLLGFSLLSAGVQAQTKNVAKPITLTGIVAGAPSNGGFRMHANGATYRVRVLSRASLRNVRGGDRVRVTGIPTRTNLQRAQVRVLQHSASDSPDDYSDTGR